LVLWKVFLQAMNSRWIWGRNAPLYQPAAQVAAAPARPATSEVFLSGMGQLDIAVAASDEMTVRVNADALQLLQDIHEVASRTSIQGPTHCRPNEFEHAATKDPALAFRLEQCLAQANGPSQPADRSLSVKFVLASLRAQLAADLGPSRSGSFSGWIAWADISQALEGAPALLLSEDALYRARKRRAPLLASPSKKRGELNRLARLFAERQRRALDFVGCTGALRRTAAGSLEAFRALLKATAPGYDSRPQDVSPPPRPSAAPRGVPRGGGPSGPTRDSTPRFARSPATVSPSPPPSPAQALTQALPAAGEAGSESESCPLAKGLARVEVSAWSSTLTHGSSSGRGALEAMVARAKALEAEEAARAMEESEARAAREEKLEAAKAELAARTSKVEALLSEGEGELELAQGLLEGIALEGIALERAREAVEAAAAAADEAEMLKAASEAWAMAEFESLAYLEVDLGLLLRVDAEQLRDTREKIDQTFAKLAEAEAEAAAAQGAGGAEEEAMYARLVSPLASEEEAGRVRAAWRHGDGDENVVVCLPAGIGGSSVDILGKHMGRMRGGWLFDESVNAYMWMLQQRDKELCLADSSRGPTHFFNSFFFEKMFESGEYKYASVRRWAKKVQGGNVFKLERLAVPVNIGNSHWCLIVAFIREKRIQYFDSMGGSGLKYCNGLKQYLADEVREPRWTRTLDKAPPKQPSTPRVPPRSSRLFLFFSLEKGEEVFG